MAQHSTEPSSQQSLGLALEQPTYERALFTILLYEEEEAWGQHFELLLERSLQLPEGTPLRWARLFKVKPHSQDSLKRALPSFKAEPKKI